jgi:hypothetical protein
MPKSGDHHKTICLWKISCRIQEDKGGLLRFYKEHIDTLKRANEVTGRAISKRLP